jgi:hypothetical protein
MNIVKFYICSKDPETDQVKYANVTSSFRYSKYGSKKIAIFVPPETNKYTSWNSLKAARRILGKYANQKAFKNAYIKCVTYESTTERDDV